MNDSAGYDDRPRGKSPQRPIRIPDPGWYPAVAKAKEIHRPIGHIVTELLAMWVTGEIQLHQARPSDMPGAGERCKDCGMGVTWIGPGDGDWGHS